MTCEKCLNEALIRHMADPTKSQDQHYQDIIEEHKAKLSWCSAKESAGQWWDERKQKDSRLP